MVSFGDLAQEERPLARNGHSSPAASTSAPLQPLTPIDDHFYNCFRTGEFADVHLSCLFLQDGMQTVFALHSIIIARSPFLVQLLRAKQFEIVVSDPNILPYSLNLAIAYLYSTSVLSHLLPQNCRDVLATAHFLRIDSLVAYAAEIAQKEIESLEDPEEFERWFQFLGTKSLVGNLGEGRFEIPSPSPSIDSEGFGGEAYTSNQGNGREELAYGPYGRTLRSELLERLIVKLPHELLEASASNQRNSPAALEVLIPIFVRLPFGILQQAFDSPRLPIPSDQDRFNLAKRIISERKKRSTAQGPIIGIGEFDEHVVLTFGSGTNVSIMRKVRRKQVWKINNV